MPVASENWLVRNTAVLPKNSANVKFLLATFTLWRCQLAHITAFTQWTCPVPFYASQSCSAAHRRVDKHNALHLQYLRICLTAGWTTEPSSV